MDGEQKTSVRANCKGQLALILRVIKRTVQRTLHRMGFGSRRPKRVSLLNARHRAACLTWEREPRHCSLEDWKGVAWNDESRFRLLNAEGR
ncbi:HTH_Tnp_Tc3_2 domain-containing protein [Trichonephila clavipes]|nr:HTH_Tnp_Tc3_2 domain-containing protein [Trichonephila clavipes]